ncbi:MAG TPA: glycosyltransferase family 4 protein [Nocardioidaceae bacterium]|nr:glycosyltransferase family 4 protein [Nocardioidaceae bacterium]
MTFLLPRADGRDGVPRTVINLANHLVDGFDVEIIGLLRGNTEPAFEIDQRITVRHVMDVRPFGPDGERRNLSEGGVDEHGNAVTRKLLFERQQPSAVAPLDPRHWASSDQPLIETLRSVRSDVVVGTTPALNLFVGSYAPSGVAKVGQDHMNFVWRTRDQDERAMMCQGIQGLDVFVPLTMGDQRDYQELLPDATTWITAIPNALSWPIADRAAPVVDKVVVAAGRLEEQKAFDRLITAYAPLVASRPGWRLDIYGSGSEMPKLRRLIKQLGVGRRVTLRGHSNQMPAVLRGCAIFAMSSEREGFPMVLLEAMSVGLPMVAYDCPRGPAEVLRDGVNGRLIPDGDDAAFTAALTELMDSVELRRQMGAAALADAAAYSMPHIVTRWEAVFARLGVHPEPAVR